MGKDAAASATFLRVVDAAGTLVPCGSTVAAGTALTVVIDGLAPAVDQYVLEISGASFLSGPCDRTRSNDAAGEVALAAGETASLLGAHAHKYGVVSITESCSLTAAAAPTREPTPRPTTPRPTARPAPSPEPKAAKPAASKPH